jgi:DNA-binding LytR/AlgR family response regulator
MMTCIAVDDEDLALDYISDNIQQVPFLRLVGRCKNSFEANEYLKNQKIDLIYLDIQMPGISGLQFIQSLTTPPMIILTTAYEKYALEGYSLDVVDYLLKPIEFERFLKASNKAFELLSLKNSQAHQEKLDDNTLFVHADYSLLKLKINEVMYIEGLKDYVKIYTATQKHPILVRLNMKLLEDRLAKNNFIRVHKSFLVNSEKITSIRRGKITMGEAFIPIGEFYKDQLDRYVDPKSLQ